MAVENELKQQTEKMLRDIKSKRQKVRLIDTNMQSLLKNIDAYISDTSHFLEKKDFIRAFEAVIWSWSILELGLELGIFIQTTKDLHHGASES